MVRVSAHGWEWVYVASVCEHEIEKQGAPNDALDLVYAAGNVKDVRAGIGVIIVDTKPGKALHALQKSKGKNKCVCVRACVCV